MIPIRFPLSARRLFFGVLALGTTAGVFVYLFRFVSARRVLELISGASLPGLALFGTASLAMSVFRTWRYAVLLEADGWHPPRGSLFLVTLARNFFSDLLPARIGTLVYVFLVRTRLGVPLEAAAGSWMLALVFDLAALGLLIVMATAATGLRSLWIAVLGVALCAAALAAVRGLPAVLGFLGAAVRRLAGRRPWGARAGETMNQTAASLEQVGTQGGQTRIMALSLSVRAAKYLSLYGLLIALVEPLGYGSREFPLPSVFFGICAAEAAASLPISGLGAFGAYEGAWFAVFRLLGYPPELAAATGISHHLITQVYGYSLGAVALLVLWLLRPSRRLRRRPAAGPVWRSSVFWGLWGAANLLLAGMVFAVAVRGAAAVEVPAGNRPDGPPDGWVVFQRPDGIYLQQTGAAGPRRLAAGGTYPRWSPDGRTVAFLRAGRVWHLPVGGGRPRPVAETRRPRALAFGPDGNAIYFTDTDAIRAVDLRSGSTATVIDGFDFYEVDIGPQGRRLATTIKTLWGYEVRVWDLKTGRHRPISRGCSASLSPDGRRVTVNGADHTRLVLHAWDDGRVLGAVEAPGRRRFDNQYWSNHPQWIVSRTEDDPADIFAHHVGSNRYFRLTALGDCDRPDLYAVVPVSRR